MVFSSVLFVFLFLPLALLGYFSTAQKYRNTFLLAASLFFYAWGEKFLVLILVGSLMINYYLSLSIADAMRKNRQATSKLLVMTAVIANLIPLFYFKYSNFFIGELGNLLGDSFELGKHWQEVVLPIGISFYTFQAMSYVIDVYRQDTPPAESLVDFACYVTCFPQLIAGPIVRYKDIAKQLQERTVSIHKFSNATQIFIIGLAKKVLIANTLAKTADGAFSLPVEQLNIVTSWLGAVCYTLQIYYDFSGYTDMAIGLGLMFGFAFPQNFNHPYAACSVQDFWRRWHISLSTWFRDYLYIPLGGNRCSKWRTFVNLWIVFILCGLWHGASWNFVLWGAFHGFFLVMERSINPKISSIFPLLLKRTYVLFIVVIGWVIFRTDTLMHMKDYFAAMFSFGHNNWSAMDTPLIYQLSNDFFIALFFGILFSVPMKISQFNRFSGHGKRLLPLIYSSLLILCLTFLINSTYNPFLYFRF